MARWMKRSWLTPRMMLCGGRRGTQDVWSGARAQTAQALLLSQLLGQSACPHQPPALCPCPAARQACLSYPLHPIWARTSWGQRPLPPGALPDWLCPSKDPAASPGRPAGLAPGQVEGQLVQLLCVGLCGLHQLHLAACGGEGPHLLQQGRPGPIQVGSKVLILLGGDGWGA